MVHEIWRLDQARTRSISAENPTGAPGQGGRATTGTGADAARDLGVGWKVSPSILVNPGQTAVLADITGPGIIRHFWLTTDRSVLQQITLRLYWDSDTDPSIDVPLGSFFCNAWDQLGLVGSEMVVVAPAGGFNSYWPMPFRAHARIELTNGADHAVPVYYQVTYLEEDVPREAGYLHASWRHVDPLGHPAIHTVLDDTPGPGRYVGTYLSICPNAPAWWGEGEMKFYFDGDTEFPTICGTGTEDYFGGAWNFDIDGAYRPYSTPYLGLVQALPPDQIYQPQQRFGMYRWHVRDPICFQRSMRVTIQALGWGANGRYLPLEDAEIGTTALWYQNRLVTARR
ncbi:glycoside hydrolase family 172 protein [Nocardia sp. NPDC051570]|uniref:glycoside hydrolase family 172 protein n=1 Tax=Nocardia sp. NPDC051570 TaxID=3364324 RepID=UPI0037B29439